MRSTSQSPTPGSAAPSSGAGVAGLMRSAQAHVRLLGYPEFFSTGHGGADGRLGTHVVRLHSTKDAAAAAENATGFLSTDGGGAAAAGVLAESSVSGVFTSGHTIEEFFESAVAPAVESSLAGQSFAFVVAGPPSSGRSQTIYGDNRKIKGIAELAVERLLKITGQGDAARHADPEAAPSPTTGNRAQPVITCSAFYTLGDGVFDANTHEAVDVLECTPPLGTVPLAAMPLVTCPKDGVHIPRRRPNTATASFFTQIHVQVPPAPGDAERRGSYASLTFVDLAAISGAGTSAFPSDVLHLQTALRAAVDGGDPCFGACALTRLLEQAIVGSVTLVGVAALTGLTTLHGDTAAAIALIGDIGRVQQVLTLVATTTPAWVPRAFQDLQEFIAGHEERVEAQRARACADVHRVAAAVLQTGSALRQDAFDHLLLETDAVRTQAYRKVQEEGKALERRLQEVSDIANSDEQRLRAATSLTDTEAAQIAAAEEELRTIEHKQAALVNDTEGFIARARLQLAAAKDTNSKRAREHAEHTEAAGRLQQHASQRAAAWERRAEIIRYQLQIDAARVQSEALADKRRRLEEQSATAAQRAKDTADADRHDRLRRSQLTRLTQLENRVTQLREKQQHTAASASEPALGHSHSSISSSARVLSSKGRVATSASATRGAHHTTHHSTASHSPVPDRYSQATHSSRARCTTGGGSVSVSPPGGSQTSPSSVVSRIGGLIGSVFTRKAPLSPQRVIVAEDDSPN